MSTAQELDELAREQCDLLAVLWSESATDRARDLAEARLEVVRRRIDELEATQ